MHSLKEKIVEKLERLPENALQEVLDFVDSLEWQKATQAQHEEWQLKEIEESCPVKYVGGVLVVQAQSRKTQAQENLNTVVYDLREERIRKFTTW
ncbi:DUF2281 domain-containing protein [Iningainema tapete]|uniref:DUF2281 domain-containing protein n=1 Tax=Iningainema tapete BLCC-T55 TaxID=2748662 RepID=A0A8J7C5M4_9CYAN|nr:DUF2281 domain-containing protein [Iningainema tapete]MBD2771001.1 hypothetical protein [Iningainema tapete BLCC-T55]